MRCDPPQRNGPQPTVNSSETTPAQATNDIYDPDDAPHDDDVDANAVDANIEHNLLAPLRSSGIHVPNRLLTQQEAWTLAHHTSEVTSTQEDVLFDPWNNNQFYRGPWPPPRTASLGEPPLLRPAGMIPGPAAVTNFPPSAK